MRRPTGAVWRASERLAIALVSVTTLMLAGCGGAGAGGSGPQVPIRFANTVPNSQLLGVTSGRLVDSLQGTHRFKVSTYFNGSLYNQTQLGKAVSDHEVDMGLTPLEQWSNLEPALGFVNLPLIFPNAADASKAFDGQVGSTVSGMLSKHGVTALGYLYYAYTNTYGNSKHEIRQPSDLSGLRIRSFGDLPSRVIAAYGGVPVTLDPAETYTGLQHGTVDGAFSSATSFVFYKWTEVVKYATVVPQNLAVYPLLVNTRWWHSLSDSDRNAVQSSVKSVVAWNRQNLTVSDQKGVDQLKKAGVKVNEIPESALGPWRQPVSGVFSHFKSQGGSDGERLVRQVQNGTG